MQEFVEALDQLPNLSDLPTSSETLGPESTPPQIEQEVDSSDSRQRLHPLIAASATVLYIAVIIILLILAISVVMSQ